MGFFKDLSEMIGEGTITLSITKSNDKMYILVIPKIKSEDTNADKISPMSLSGLPEDIDENFIDTIKSSFNLLKTLSAEMSLFEKSIAHAADDLKKKAADNIKSKTIQKGGKNTNEDTSQKTLISESDENSHKEPEINLEDDTFDNSQNEDQPEPEKPVTQESADSRKIHRNPKAQQKPDMPGSEVKPEPAQPGPVSSAPAGNNHPAEGPLAGNNAQASSETQNTVIPKVTEDEEW